MIQKRERGRLCERTIRIMPQMGILSLIKRWSHVHSKRPSPGQSDSKAEPQSHRTPGLSGREGLSLWAMWDTYGQSVTLG